MNRFGILVVLAIINPSLGHADASSAITQSSAALTNINNNINTDKGTIKNFINDVENNPDTAAIIGAEGLAGVGLLGLSISQIKKIKEKNNESKSPILSEEINIKGTEKSSVSRAKKSDPVLKAVKKTENFSDPKEEHIAAVPAKQPLKEEDTFSKKATIGKSSKPLPALPSEKAIELPKAPPLPPQSKAVVEEKAAAVPAVDEGRSGLLEEIRKGKALKSPKEEKVESSAARKGPALPPRSAKVNLAEKGESVEKSVRGKSSKPLPALPSEKAIELPKAPPLPPRSKAVVEEKAAAVPAVDEGRSGLLEEIRKGKALKATKEEKIESPAPSHNITNILHSTSVFNKALQKAAEHSHEEENESWDDVEEPSSKSVLKENSIPEQKDTSPKVIAEKEKPAQTFIELNTEGKKAEPQVKTPLQKENHPGVGAEHSAKRGEVKENAPAQKPLAQTHLEQLQKGVKLKTVEPTKEKVATVQPSPELSFQEKMAQRRRALGENAKDLSKENKKKTLPTERSSTLHRATNIPHERAR